MGKHTDKLNLVIENLSRQNADMHESMMQTLIQLGIYQGAYGGLPQDVVSDVIGELNSTAPEASANKFLAKVRDIAVRKVRDAKAAQEPIQGVTTSTGGHSPYSVSSGASVIPPPVLGTDKSPIDTAVQSLIHLGTK